MNMRFRSQNGVTLIEILSTVVIIGREVSAVLTLLTTFTVTAAFVAAPPE